METDELGGAMRHVPLEFITDLALEGGRKKPEVDNHSFASTRFTRNTDAGHLHPERMHVGVNHVVASREFSLES